MQWRQEGPWDDILEVDLPPRAKQFLLELAGKIAKEIDRVNAVDVAEIGCGRGELIHNLAKRMPQRHFAGYDLSRKAVAKLRDEALPNEEFHPLVLPRVPGRTFDCVLSINTLHYVPQALLSIQRMWTIVRPGGRLMFNYPNTYYAALLPSEPQSDQWATVEKPMRTRANLLSQLHVRDALPGGQGRQLHASGRFNIYLVFEKPT